MINKVSIDKCCGCEACSQACPMQCIEMIGDAEGFLVPQIDLTKCTRCNRCEKVCPAISKSSKRTPVEGYAYRSNDEELLRKTSSGGFFTAIAEKVLSHGGVVFGASFNARNEVVHTYVESISALDQLRRSKYVQSRIGNSFVDCRKFLVTGRTVLFSGTPCQIKALKLFLVKDYENLIAVDFVCHGVPSPGVFKKYLNEICDKYHEKVSDVKAINFREKILGSPFAFSLITEKRKYVENPKENSFLRGFLADMYLRKSCHHCGAKSFSSGSDYSMCDFWGIKKIMPNFTEGNIPGVSQVFVLNDKLHIFESIGRGSYVANFDPNDLKARPRWLSKSVPMTSRRKKFFEKSLAGCTVRESVSKVSNQSVFDKMRLLCLSTLATIARKVGVR